MSTPIEAPDNTEGADEESHDPAEEGHARMSFLEHLEELRKRIIYSLYGLIAGCCISFWFVDRLNTYMLRYFNSLFTASTGGKLIFTEITEAFMFKLKIGALAGLILAVPFIFAQFWFFVAPGLYTREKRVVIPFVLWASVLFLAGVYFGHLVAFPSMMAFFATQSNEYLAMFLTLKGVFSFYIKMVLGLGLVFQMPILVFFLARFGIVDAKFLINKARYAILIIFIIAALLTPSPDFVNQFIFATPMLGLYAISIGVAWLFGKKKKKE
jgi:sec-independent protein translocase protein TatC